MNFQFPASILLLASLTLSAAEATPAYSPAAIKPPPLPTREFRGAWVATVANIDWPSKPGLLVDQQKAELIAILDRAAKFNLNAIILQVRPACDAMYASQIEPWSYYLTGEMGRAPEPFYDPLTFAVTEAHKRGLELHAWFNPYRAGILASKSVPSANHISKTHPNLVRKYGGFLWLDPGEKEVQDYSLSVVMDVVNRYDIDGVHFDDYFYPYKELDAQKQEMDFPDEASWKRYGARGRQSRDDWRRENVNLMVRRVYDSIKAVKPWVKFGVSPFGIWQPGYPQQIKGFNSYATLYCDSRKWLANGWVDYCSPQLYWSIDLPDQSFPVLLKWWSKENPKHRNIWPGINSDKVGRRPKSDEPSWTIEEIINQIKIERRESGSAAGVIHWSMKALMQNRGGLGIALINGLYAERALVPPSPWLERRSPAKPRLQVVNDRELNWEPAATEKISAWVLQTRTDNQWHTSILPGETRAHLLSGSLDAIALTAIDRCGLASSPMVLKQEAEPGSKEK
jgi:uncharacterized lipoprotein YddW (UPF0748 family)